MDIDVLNFNDQVLLNSSHTITIDHTDLTEATADTAQTFTVSLPDGGLFRVNFGKLVEAFEDASDAAFNTTALTVGDGGSATRFLASTELNANGTEIDYFPGALGTLYAYNTADTVDITFAAMAAKSLVNIDTGKLVLFVTKIDAKEVGDRS